MIPTKLLIRQRIFTWGDNYQVCNEDGDPIYDVESDLFTLGHRIRVYDKKSGRELGSIRQKLLTLLPVFEIVVDGRLQGTVRREFSLFRPSYRVDYHDWQIQGDIFGWDYRVMQGDLEIMSISKEFFNWSDTYVLNCENPAFEMPGLLLVLAIDAANCSHND